MGTTAEKLQAVLNSKNAIKEKFRLADDLPFSQYADNIRAGGDGGSAEYYKCESVSANPPTWNGYKAYLTPNEAGDLYYVFEETLTEGLTYGQGLKPQVGKVYDSTAMMRAELFESAVVFNIVTPVTIEGLQYQALSSTTLQATVSDGSNVTFYPSEMPDGISCTSGGVISGTPAGYGEFSTEVIATSVQGQSKTIKVNFAIVKGEIITVTTPVYWEVGQLEDIEGLQLEATVSDGSTPIFTETDGHGVGALPRGLFMTESGLITGKLSGYGNFHFNVTVSAKNAQPKVIDATIYAEPAGIIELPASSISVSGKQNDAITAVPVGATLNPSQLGTLSYAASGFPSGVTCSADGVISGTPTKYGNFTGKVEITSDFAAPKTQTVNFDIEPAAEITVTTPVTVEGTQKQAITAVQLQASISDGSSLNYSASGFPSGISCSSSGRISGTPTGSGNFTGTVTVSSPNAESKTIRVNFVIAPQIPQNGLVFYAPLNERKSTAETKQTLTYNGNVQFTTVNGRKCAYLNGSSYIQFSDTGFPTGGNERTIACWVKQTSADTGYQHVFGYGGDGSYKKFYICVNPNGYISFTQYGSDFGTSVSPNVWKFVVIVHKDGQQKIYINGGVESASGGLSVNTSLAAGRIGASQNVADDEFFKGYVADAVLYNYAFTPQQIDELYQILAK